MRVIGNRELEDIEAKESGVLAEAVNDNSVAAYLMDCWTKAKNFKEQGAEEQILKNMRQIDGTYEADKLAAIKKIGGSTVFMMITDAKCKNAKDWVNDIVFQSNARPFGVQPSPLPDLPDVMKQAIAERTLRSVVEMIASQQPELLQNPQAIQQIMQELMPQMEGEVKAEVIREAKKISEKMELKIDDKLQEGKWYEALRDTIKNVVMHTGILKGPVFKKRRIEKAVTNEDGRIVTQIVEDIIPTFESRHPLYIYPAPGSTDVNDGYLFDRIKVTPMKLQELIGVPGYDVEELEAVLTEANSGVLRNWLNLRVDQDIADINEEVSTIAYDSDKIDCLEFWGYVNGEKLKEWGLTVDEAQNPINDTMYYNISAYLIHNHVIKIEFNDDPLGRKPFYRASFEEREGSFWGKGLPEIIVDCQQTCNAAARAIVNNAGMASGPQVERNIDRIPPAVREDNTLTPWKVWDVTDSMMISNSPALKFYQPPMVVERLMNMYTTFSKIADEHSGVPAFAHGDPNVGGAGNTASGLSMLMSSSARGIKALVNNIDRNITAASVLRQYHLLIQEEENFGLICDYNVITLGSTASLQKEQLAARRIEFMQATANPLDMQIIGVEGRKYLLEETAKSMQLDMQRLFPPTSPPPPQQSSPEQLGNAGEPVQKGQTLDAAGNPAQGVDTRTAGNGGDGGQPIQRREFGGRVKKGQPYVVGEGGTELFVPKEDGTIIPNVETTAKLDRAAIDKETEEVFRKAYAMSGGDMNRTLDYLAAERQRDPGNLAKRNAEYYTWSHYYTNAGVNPISQVVNLAGYQALKKALPDTVYNYAFGYPQDTPVKTTTPTGGSMDWTIKGINDASVGKILGLDPKDFIK